MDIEDLCCGICQQNFDSTYRDPRMLHCGHSFCSVCLKDLFSRDIKACPEDGVSLNVISIEELPKNFALLKFLSKSPPKADNRLCADHKKLLEYMCIQDKSKVCANCALFGQHRGHEIRPLDDLLQEITLKAECLLDMLQIVERSQKTVMDENIKRRLDILYDKYKKKKSGLEHEIKDGFNKLRNSINEMEKSALSQMNKNFEHIENNIVNIRDIPKLIDSQTTNWKFRVKDKLDTFTRQSDDPSYIALDILDNVGGDLFQSGEKLIVDLEGLKDIQIDPLEESVNELSVSFTEIQISNICTIKPSARQSIIPTDSRHSITPEDFIDTPDMIDTDLILSNEDIFNQVLEEVKNNATEIADFTSAGDLGDKVGLLGQYLINNNTLKTLKLVKNFISDSAACEVFRSLQENSTLQSLHLSQNSLGDEALEELIEMLNVNTTLRDIYLIGNPRMSADYKARFAKMSSRFRKIYT